MGGKSIHSVSVGRAPNNTRDNTAALRGDVGSSVNVRSESQSRRELETIKKKSFLYYSCNKKKERDDCCAITHLVQLPTRRWRI